MFEPAPGLRREMIDTRHGQVHVRLAGRLSNQPAVVLLHMSPVSGAMYVPVMAPLATTTASLIVAPDRLGFGASDTPTAALDMRRYAEATLDVMDALGVERAHLVGTHTGAVEAIELTTQSPARVQSVVLVALPVFSPDEVIERKRRFFRPPEPAEDGSHLLWHWRRRFLFRNPPWDLPLFQWRLIEELIAAPALENTYFAVYDYPSAERLSQIDQPLLVLAPQDDLVEVTRRARSQLPPQAVFTELPHMGLDLFRYHRDELVERLAGWWTVAANPA